MTDKNGQKLTGRALLDLAKAHAAALRPVRIPEWGAPGEPMTVYARLVSKSQMKQLRGKHGDDIDSLSVAVVIFNICDEAGNPLFDYSQRDELLTLPSAIIDRMANAALGAYRPEEQVKN